MLLLILTTLSVILVTTWFINYYRYNRYLKQYSGPIPIPVLGSALSFGTLKDMLPILLKLHKKHGPAFKVNIGFLPPAIQISDPKLLESLLSSPNILYKGSEYRFLQRWLGTGLLTSGPPKWKKHRKILTPAFHFQILEQFLDSFILYTDVLVDHLHKEVENNSTDLYPYIALCSLDIICATSMGTTVYAQKDGTSEYVKSVKEITRLLMERTVSLLYVYNFIYSFTANYRAEVKAIKILHNYTNSVIASRTRELQNTPKSIGKKSSDFGIKQRRSFLDLLLKYKLDGGDITDEEIREEVDTFMFEGHDTSSNAICYALYSIANNPEVQKKCIDELNYIFGGNKRKCLESRDLHEMKYLEMVIKETLRLYPSVPLFSRGIREDTEFNGGILPKHTTLIVFAFGVHRNPEIYPDPDKFDPERFTPEMQATRPPYAYIPFSAGPRNCIGQKFAMLEMKTVISKVLMEFELLPAIPEHKLLLAPELILKSRSGTCIRLRKR